MDINNNSLMINNVLEHVCKFNITDNVDDGVVDAFMFPINSREFDYRQIVDGLLESVADFTLSKKIRDDYAGKPMTLSKHATLKFKEWRQNNGELGEFLLFCFLEGHLGAPKILSKMELKTAQNMYVHGSDGVHVKRISDDRFQLIFGESKLLNGLTDGLREAFNSIKEFRYELNSKGEFKSGINFEKGLINSNLDKETFDEEEKNFLRSIIYPSESQKTIHVDDCFGVFVGFEVDVSEQKVKLNNEDFYEYVKSLIEEAVNKQKQNIINYITNNNLVGHTFYLYILPFTELDKQRKELLRDLGGK